MPVPTVSDSVAHTYSIGSWHGTMAYLDGQTIEMYFMF